MRVHIHANCQAAPLAGLLSEVYPDWQISFFLVHAPQILDQLDRHYYYVRNADVVISQPIHDGYRERDDMSIGWVKSNIRPGAALISIPSAHFGAHQATWEEFPFPGFDLLAAHLVASGLRPADALRHLLSAEFLTDADIEREIETAIAETERRELADAIDVRISPFLEEHGRTRLLFHIHKHPTRETMVFIANEVLERMGFPRRVPIAGLDYQAYPHAPPLPSVTRYLHSRAGKAPDRAIYDTVRLHSVPEMSLETYYGQMVERLASRPPEDLFAYIEQRWPLIQVLRRLAANRSAIPGIERWAS